MLRRRQKRPSAGLRLGVVAGGQELSAGRRDGALGLSDGGRSRYVGAASDARHPRDLVVTNDVRVEQPQQRLLRSFDRHQPVSHVTERIPQNDRGLRPKLLKRARPPHRRLPSAEMAACRPLGRPRA